jgi:hypothetical protein
MPPIEIDFSSLSCPKCGNTQFNYTMFVRNGQSIHAGQCTECTSIYDGDELGTMVETDINYNGYLPPTLYKRTPNGKIQQWRIWTSGSYVNTEYGELSGKMQYKQDLIKEGKNIGKRNETTPIQQAVVDATNKWNKRYRDDHWITVDDASAWDIGFYKNGTWVPMLAKKYQDRKHKIDFDNNEYIAQPKLDGCLYRNTQIITDKGIMLIEDIVESKLNVKVLSFNHETNKLEYRKVLGWFKNGTYKYKRWLDITPKYGTTLRCTKKHYIFTNKGYKMAHRLKDGYHKLMSIYHFIDPRKDNKVCVSNINVDLPDNYLYTDQKVYKSKYFQGDAVRYDIEVEHNHNYFADGVLVHNCRGPVIHESAMPIKVFNDNRKLYLASRKGQIIETLPHIVKELETIMNDGDIFDGEIYLHGMPLNQIHAIVSAKKNLKSAVLREKLQFHVFDAPRINGLTESDTFQDRYNALMVRLLSKKLKHIKLVRCHTIKSHDDIKSLHDEYVNKGYEGLMIRLANAPYEQTRTESLLKYKEFEDEEFDIVGFKEGKGKLMGHIGSFECQMKNGKRFNAKLEGDESYLKYLFNHPEEFMNKPLMVRFFEYNEYGVPSFPVGKIIRWDK